MNFSQLKMRASQIAELEGWQDVQPAPDWAALVNQGLIDFSWDTECSIQTVSFTSVTNQAEYPLPAPDWKLITDCIYGAIPLMKSSEMAERRYDPLWITRPAATPSRFFVSNPNTLRIHYPPPDSTTTVTVRGIQALAPLVNDTDIPAAPARFHEAIALRAAILLCFVVGTPQTQDALAKREAEYLRIVDSCKQYLSGEQNSGFVRRVRRPLPERINLGGIGEYGGSN